MLPKGGRRRTVRPAYIAAQEAEPEPELILSELEDDEDDLGEGEGAHTRSLTVDSSIKDLRVDQYLSKCIPDISRARVQLLIESGQVQVDGRAVKASHKLQGGERIAIEGEPRPAPLHAVAEDIPLDIIYEDTDLAVVNKPAGMMVHAGSGATDDARNRGTLVNALLHHFAQLSEVGGALRPGIVHRLDKQTSGLIVVAKNDSTHRKLGEMFSARELTKTYLALVHGHPARDKGTIDAAISRDTIRRTRMTVRRVGGRTAVSHYKVIERIDGPYGKFALVEVRIETGRTHQIRVHMASIGYAVVGDTLYGAPALILPLQSLQPALANTLRKRTVRQKPGEDPGLPVLSLDRNFLHAAQLEFAHPRIGKTLLLATPLAPELESFAALLRGGHAEPPATARKGRSVAKPAVRSATKAAGHAAIAKDG